MLPQLKINKNDSKAGENTVFLMGSKANWKATFLSREETAYATERFKEGESLVGINRLDSYIYVVQLQKTDKKLGYQLLELYRGMGSRAGIGLNALKHKKLHVVNAGAGDDAVLAFTEGITLGNYQFLKYRKEGKKEEYTLAEISISGTKLKKQDLEQLAISCEAVWIARDLVNEPQSYLDAVQLSREFQKLSKKSGFKLEILNKSKIESLKMGGLLAVNKGSQIPPTFSIMEWKPAKPLNKKPIVLVGKGVVYDTGGLSLKPTPNSMDQMKCDMAGAAIVGATLYALARMESPYHVIGLVPATDNRPGENAYTPGDVITMYSGLNVEVLNTDAEGRMILADALEYAKKFDPELVLDFATLTGAAAAAIGPFGIVCMGTAEEQTKAALSESGRNVYERLVEFPFWEEYRNLIKSDVAEIKNIGGPIGGAITAGKFLECFTDYPWMHFDIAGPAYITSPDSYRGKYGTGVGVRLLLDYLKNRKA